MYYMLTPDLDPKVIGSVNFQVAEAQFSVPVDHPFLTRNIFLKYVPEEQAVTPTAVLAKRAKLTDLLSGATGGHTWQLIVSDKLKQILQRQNNPGIQFLSTIVIYKNVELTSYWLVNPFCYDMDAVNFRESNIYLTGSGGAKIKQVQISNRKQFEEMQDSLELPLRLSITNLVINADVTESLILIKWVRKTGGLCYCVSEGLKMEIEDAGCTGIDFFPVQTA